MRDRKAGEVRRSFIRGFIGFFGVFAAIIVLIIVLTAVFGSHSKKTTVNTTSTGSSSSRPTQTSSSPTAAKASAHVGATLSVKDQNGNAMDVTLVKVVNPATGADQYTTPDSGKHFVGVQLKITNKSSNTLQEFEDNDTTLFDTSSQSYNSDVRSLGDCAPFASSSSIAPGESELGCVAFQVPTGVTAAKVQFTPSSGYAKVSAEWLVP